jgi:putative DNA primase/helicase
MYKNDNLQNEEFHTQKSIYRHNKNGALYKISDEGDVLISEEYIKVIKLGRMEGNHPNDGWFNVVEFDDMDGKRNIINIPCSILLDTRETLKLLADVGFSKIYCRKPIVDYLKAALPSERIVRIKRAGWINDKEYACPSFQVTNGDNSYSLTFSEDYGFSKSGTLEEWKNNLCKYCENNSVLTLGLCVGLSGVLLKWFPGIGSSAINLVGRSSIGKTSALCVAASLWGTKKFVQQWRSTSNALEVVAESHNDGLLILDELGQISSKDLGNIVYMLGNEKGKNRLTADSELKKSKEWRIAILSSGEIGIVDKIAEAGEKAKAGQTVRFIDIESQVSDSLGIYEDVHECKSGADLSKLLKENCAKHHGVAAEEFVKSLTILSGETITEIYDTAKGDLVEKFGLSEADPQVIRVAETIALYITTGILASSDYCGVLTHDVIGVEEAIYAIFDRWLVDRGGKKSVEDDALIEHVIGFLVQHESRFKKIHSIEERTIINCLGFMEKMQTDATIFYIIPKLFRKEMCKGMNVKMVRKILKKANILQMEYIRNGERDKRILIDGKQIMLTTLVVKNDLSFLNN